MKNELFEDLKEKLNCIAPDSMLEGDVQAAEGKEEILGVINEYCKIQDQKEMDLVYDFTDICCVLISRYNVVDVDGEEIDSSDLCRSLMKDEENKDLINDVVEKYRNYREDHGHDYGEESAHDAIDAGLPEIEAALQKHDYKRDASEIECAER